MLRWSRRWASRRTKRLKFKDLLADNAMKAAEKASSMFGGLGSTNHAELVNTLTAQQKTFDEQVKAFLGDERYAQYKDYQETAGERMQLNAFKQQAGSDYNLSDQQTEALLTFMKEEKKNVAATTGLPLDRRRPGRGQTPGPAVRRQDGRTLQAQETVNQRVYERARTILLPRPVGHVRQVPDQPVADDARGHGHDEEDVQPGQPERCRGAAESVGPRNKRNTRNES